MEIITTAEQAAEAAKGLYVIVQSGDSAVVVEAPQGFKLREW